MLSNSDDTKRASMIPITTLVARAESEETLRASFLPKPRIKAAAISAAEKPYVAVEKQARISKKGLATAHTS
jgi:hypothetical protein